MYLLKKQRNKPLYKKFLLLRKNIQDRDKILKFKKKKWFKFKKSLLRSKKKKLYDLTSYFLPNFANFFKKKFKSNLLNKQKLYLFYGKLRKSYLKSVVKSTKANFKVLNMQAASLFIKKLETRLDTILYRAHFSHSLLNARQLILHKKVYVNSKIARTNSYTLKKGDIITLHQSISEFTVFNTVNSKIWPIPPKHLSINYRTLQILVIENINYTNYLIYFSFWLDFNSFLKFYER